MGKGLLIDLRSEAVTRPGRVMAEAAVGDDVFGEDPTVNLGEAEGYLRARAREGVLATSGKAGRVRLRTHLDIGDKEIDAAVEVASRLTAHSLER